MELENKKILILAANNYEDLELHYPRLRMLEEGAQVVVAGEAEKQNSTSKHGYPIKADISFDKVNVEEYCAVIIPGGYAPDILRRNPKVLEIVREFNRLRKLIAFICHAGWVPVSAKVIKGVKCTSWPSIKDDLINAGAQWVDEPVVVDGHFISSRSPEDLPKFCPAIIEHLSDLSLAHHSN